MSKKQIKKKTLISLIIGLSLFVLLFSIPFIMDTTGGISDPHYTFGESFGVSFTCFGLGLTAIVFIPVITWLSAKENKNVYLWGCSLFSFFFIILILNSGLAVTFTIWQVQQERRNLGEIVILNNRDFKSKYNFSGEGSETNPYLIENLVINTSKTYGIFIENTNKFFTIRNCTFQAKNSAIYVKNTADRTCKIVNNHLLEGLLNVYNSPSLIIENNTVQNKINLSSCHFASVIDNKCGSLEIQFSDQIIVDDNSVSSGFLLGTSRNSKISNNLFYNDSFSGMNLHNSKSLLIVNNTFSNNHYGLVIGYSELVTVLGNNCSSNNNTGMIIQYCRNVTLSNNNIHKNLKGIYLNENQFLLITRNSIKNNTEYGIISEFAGPLNRIFQNNFYYNNLAGLATGFSQGYENTTYVPLYYYSVILYDNNTNEGNFWSDLIWNEGVTYEIDGGNNTDPYPLENPVSI